MRSGKSFDLAAKTYDSSRPSYPQEVIRWIIQKTKIQKDDRLLEIGSGTGQATVPFLKQGYRVDCVERGKNLAKLLHKKVENYPTHIYVQPFEDWQPPENYQVPMIVCATAFHWLNIHTKYQKCYQLLQEGGHLILMWNIATDMAISEVEQAYRLLFSYYPDIQTKPLSLEEVDRKRKKEIEESGLFVLEHFMEHKWESVDTKQQLTNGFLSQSSYLSLHVIDQKRVRKQVEQLFTSLEEEIVTEFVTAVYIAKKKSNQIMD